MRHYDLVVIGTGSGNSIVDDAFRDLDVAIVEHGRFGGTCVNVGCIPTKMFAYTAEVADTIRGAATFELDARLDKVRWSDVQRRVLGRIDGIAEEGERFRIEGSRNVTVYLGHARFTGIRTLRVKRTDGSGHDDLSADQIVIAGGGRPLVPEPVASAGVPFETSDTVMRMREVPRRLTILGGSYIAAEFAHIFGALGAEVTIVDRADRLLGPQDETVAERFTELARRRYDVRTGREVAEVASAGAGGVRVTLDDGAVLDADALLVAVGRVPNSDRLDLDVGAVEVRDNGSIIVDAQQRTTAEGVWALGDISTPIQLKHVANREAKVVAHNLLHPDDLWETDHSALPSAIFTNPQIASVGATEQDCRDDGLDYATGIAAYSDVAFGWAMQDEDGFCKASPQRSATAASFSGSRPTRARRAPCEASRSASAAPMPRAAPVIRTRRPRSGDRSVDAMPRPYPSELRQHLGRRPLARLDRAVHVAGPVGRGLGPGPVDPAHRRSQHVAPLQQHPGGHVAHVAAAAPHVGGPDLVEVRRSALRASAPK